MAPVTPPGIDRSHSNEVALDQEADMRNQRPGRRRRLVVGVAIVVAVTALALVGLDVALGSPVIPAGSAVTPIAVVKNNSTVAADPDPADAASGAGPVVRRACLDRIERQGSWLQLCWTIGRLTNETDPAHDDYILRVAGTVHGGALPSGARWAVLRAGADPASAPFQVVDAWPGQTSFDGACRSVPMALGFYGAETDDVCGRTVGELNPSSPRTTGLTWTCAGCLVPLSGDQPILLAVRVAVDEGGTPIWDLYADLGS
jgi:hypothetical protein